MDDAVPDRVDRARPSEETADGAGVVGRRVLAGHEFVRRVEHAQLEARRTAVDDENAHAT
jgi:hypothetical protein